MCNNYQCASYRGPKPSVKGPLHNRCRPWWCSTCPGSNPTWPPAGCDGSSNDISRNSALPHPRSCATVYLWFVICDVCVSWHITCDNYRTSNLATTSQSPANRRLPANKFVSYKYMLPSKTVSKKAHDTHDKVKLYCHKIVLEYSVKLLYVRKNIFKKSSRVHFRQNHLHTQTIS